MDKAMYILVNENIKIGKGKLAGQVGHAVCSYMNNMMLNASKSEILEFQEYMKVQKKIVLRCPQWKLEELERSGHIAIRDHGLTQLEPNTLTCVNFGVHYKKDVPSFVADLKLY